MSAAEAENILNSISSSSSSSSSRLPADEKTADSISKALRSFSIEDISEKQAAGLDNEVIMEEIPKSPCESDDLASRPSSASESNDSKSSSTEESEAEEKISDAEDETSDAEMSSKESVSDEDMPPAGEMKSEKASKDNSDEDMPPAGEMKSEKASKDETGTIESDVQSTNQNTVFDLVTDSQTDQNQTSQNGSKTAVATSSGGTTDQNMDAVGFANFSLADLTAIGELEKPELVSAFQTSMYWLNQGLGMFTFSS